MKAELRGWEGAGETGNSAFQPATINLCTHFHFNKSPFSHACMEIENLGKHCFSRVLTYWEWRGDDTQTPAPDATAVFHDTLPGGRNSPPAAAETPDQRSRSTRGQSHRTVQLLVAVGRRWLGRHAGGGFDTSPVHTLPPLACLVTAFCTDTSKACESKLQTLPMQCKF